MNWQAWATIAVIVAAMGLFASERLRVDLIALMAMIALVVLGIITPKEAMAGFSNEATITVAAMFALTLGIERSGALEPLSRLLVKIRHQWLLTLALMMVIAPLGAFVKNIALVAIFLPLSLRICASTNTSPARVLMPMAYAAQMGGACTLIGTSSNLLADSLAQHYGLHRFGVFEFTPLGALLSIAGFTYLMLVGRWLLPRHVDTEISKEVKIGKYVAELRVTADSPLAGKSIDEAKLDSEFGVSPLELLRDERRLPPRSQKIAEDDVLMVRGDWEKIEEFQHSAKLESAPESRFANDEKHSRVLVEAMVAPGSRIEGRRLSDTDLNWRYKAIVLAIHRRGHVLREKLSDVRLAVGDVLMVLIEEETLPKLRADDMLIVLSEHEEMHHTPYKALTAVAIMLAVVIVSGFRLLPIPIAALCGVAAMVLTGCYGRKDVYEGMDWRIIMLLGAILSLGTAMEKTGLSQAVAGVGLKLVGQYGPLAALLMVYLLTALFTELMGHNPSVVLMVGIAISIAHAVNSDLRPFIVAVAFASATSFATPVGYPTNTMVYYAGGYRFIDFMKVGIPLILIFCALSMWLIPIFWPFNPLSN